jgi:DNA-directed RNA polymerase specialized sigma24 family protein
MAPTATKGSDTSQMTNGPQSSAFPLTRWTRVSALRSAPDSAEGRAALANLCAAYWYPVYSFARRKGHPVADAQDLTQSFFAKVLSGGLFEHADAEKGKMRTYLLTAFTRHMADEWDKAMTAKRGGSVQHLSLDYEEGEQRYLQEPAVEPAHGSSYDRAWAQSVLDRALHALDLEYAAAGKAQLFSALSPHLTASGEAASYESLSQQMRMSEDALRQAVRRMRVRFRDWLRQTVADTLDAPDDTAVDEELRTLRAILLP